MDNRGTMESYAPRSVVGRSKSWRGIHQTILASNSGGVVKTIRSQEELEELEARGINPFWNKSQFRTELENQAKQNNVLLDSSYLDDKVLLHDQRINETSENDVYKNLNGRLTKVNNLSYVKSGELHENLIAFIDRIATHNTLFPEVAYELIGFIKNNKGIISLAMEQAEVDAERNANQEEIDIYLDQQGFKRDGARIWSNGHSVWSNMIYELFDARPANVLKGNDGRLYFIDTFPHSVAYMRQRI